MCSHVCVCVCVCVCVICFVRARRCRDGSTRMCELRLHTYTHYFMHACTHSYIYIHTYIHAECAPSSASNQISTGTVTLWQQEDLLSFLSNESVHEMVIGSRLQVDWGSALSIRKVSQYTYLYAQEYVCHMYAMDLLCLCTYIHIYIYIFSTCDSCMSSRLGRRFEHTQASFISIIYIYIYIYIYIS